ncbi:MAG: DMT family transporter [Patescibacteria group bacterium]|jgi:drug/metabolite transporter (DMT)-like permease|nr:DMT family transporter [Patescibacteria group bacterium]
MKLGRQRQGELFIFSEATLWALFPIVTVFSYSSLSPLMSLAGSTIFSILFFALAVGLKKRWREFKNKEAMKDVLWIALIIGVGYYSLIFLGLNYTSPGNASIIAFTAEILFSFIFFHLWRKDYIPLNHLMGAMLMATAAGIVLYPNTTSLNHGDLLILLAAAVPPLGNFFQQRARKKISSESIMLGRSLISAVAIMALALIFGGPVKIIDLKTSILFLLINGFLLMGLSKILWIEGIHRISVTKATSLSTIAPILTILFSWFFLQQSPTGGQLLAIIPMILGVGFLATPAKEPTMSDTR